MTSTGLTVGGCSGTLATRWSLKLRGERGASTRSTVRTQMKQPGLSVILPVHNEVESLERVVAEWDAALRKNPGLHYAFIICEDGSTDGTKELIVQLETRYSILNNSVSWRRGYGQAVRDGLQLAETDYVLFIDSDGQIGPEQINEVWGRRSEDHFLIGWRYPRRDPPVRLIYSKLFKLYHGILFPNRLHDPSCPFVLGHTKLLERVAPLLVYMKEGFWWGFVGACWKLKIPMDEIQVRHRERIAGDTQVYKLTKMPGIVFRNCIGLLRLRFA
jgi:glycosyltransferase involved in cell wall biosynthesis